MADTTHHVEDHTPEVVELNSVIGQVRAMVSLAVGSVGNDGKIDPIEAIQLAMMGVELVKTIIATVQAHRDKDKLKFVAENSRLHLPA
jgi:hypothetical protein